MIYDFFLTLDYSEYDSGEERLVWCEDDICIFWSNKNDKIFIRRLVTLDKAVSYYYLHG